VEIGVEDSHLITTKSQRSSQVNGYGTLAHSSLAAHDHNFMPDMEELLLQSLTLVLFLLEGRTVG
jgi:hypothetical protein